MELEQRQVNIWIIRRAINLGELPAVQFIEPGSNPSKQGDWSIRQMAGVNGKAMLLEASMPYVKDSAPMVRCLLNQDELALIKSHISAKKKALRKHFPFEEVRASSSFN